MFQQKTLVTAICDHCRTPAQSRHDDGDVTLLFADEDQARETLGLDEPDGHWRQLANSLLICGPCALIHDCVLAGGHHFTDWASCTCEGWRDDHATNEALGTGVCGYEARICPQCHTTEQRRSTTIAVSISTLLSPASTRGEA